MTNEVKLYTDKAIELLDMAKSSSDPTNHRQASLMALSYLRLAQMAKKNERTDIVYETPVLPQQTIHPRSTISRLTGRRLSSSAQRAKYSKTAQR